VQNDGDVKIVVSNSFDDIVLDETKDVLLEVYAPWCGHCKKLEPEYNRLGEVLRNIPSIVISKMDGTKNEHALVQVSLFFAFLSLVLGLLDAHKAITSPMVLNLFLVILFSSRIALGNFWDSRSLVTTMPSYPTLYMPCFDNVVQKNQS
jgi:thiol-disulfide isomerase/thioredoxin